VVLIHVSGMSHQSLRVTGLAEASVDEKLALIDELWESVRRSAQIEIRPDHLSELDRRAAAVAADPTIALSPAQARALLRK
jgi:putative addiction module component (TIGR02574 family)